MMTASSLRAAGCLCAAVLTIPCGSALAQSPGLTPVTPVAHASEKEYALAHKSSFNPGSSTDRNPFWPIGWTPSSLAAGPAEAAAPDVPASAFNVSATSLDYPSLAVINGHTYGVGEQVPVPSHPGTFVRVRQILDGTVILDYRGFQLRATSAPAVTKSK